MIPIQIPPEAVRRICADTLTRKEIADAIGVSIDTVERKESEWGLDKCRCVRTSKPILFFKSKVVSRLMRAKVIASPF